MDKLAFYGGEALRKKPFPSNRLGAILYGVEELEELKDVVFEKSPFRHYGPGKPTKVANLEKVINEYFGSRFTLAVSSGTSALFCAVAALGLGPGDEVILAGFNWLSDYCALVNLGVLPVFAEVDKGLGLDPIDFKKKITPRTKAVIVVHFQGGPAQIGEIVSIARTYGIKVIEDCAQALGGEYNKKKLGTFGDISVLSFQVNKMLTCGEGGAIITDNEEYFVRAVRYHDLGFVRPMFTEQLDDKSLADPERNFAGMQFRMNELSGAVMLAQFSKLDMILEKCRTSHKKIREHFNKNRHFKIRYTEGDCGITLFMLFKTAEEAKKFRICLESEGISTGGTSACENLTDDYFIKSKRLAHDSLPPFATGFNGENVEYSSKKCCPHTNNIIERYVAVGIGPLYAEEDINDIKEAIEKVDASLYA